MTTESPGSEWAPLDAAYRAFEATTEHPPWGSLVAQTIVTAAERRRLLQALGPRPGWKTLDVGTGYGAIPLELGHLAALEAVGVDTDAALLSAAAEIASAIEGQDFLQQDASVSFLPGDAYALPFPAGTFDLVTARLVFQHLAEPSLAAREMHRVARRGALALIYDVDDGLSACWPPASAETDLLDSAYSISQAARGGDREVGRKLSSYLADAGFAVEQVLVLPQALHEGPGAEDLARPVTTARYLAARDAMIETGLLDAASFDRCLEAANAAVAVSRCRIECQVAVLARRG